MIRLFRREASVPSDWTENESQVSDSLRFSRLEKLATPIHQKEKTMNNLRRLVVTLCLTSVLAVTAFAGETQTPPCTPDPGTTQGPPCATAPLTTDDSTNPGETETPPSSDTTAYVVSVVEETLLQFLMF